MVKEWLEISVNTGGAIYTQPEDIHSIDAAVERWISSSRQRDTLLHLTGWVGEEIVVLASTICGWWLNTLDLRAKQAAQTFACDQEKGEIRAELGLWDTTGNMNNDLLGE